MEPRISRTLVEKTLVVRFADENGPIEAMQGEIAEQVKKFMEEYPTLNLFLIQIAERKAVNNGLLWRVLIHEVEA